MFNTGNNNDANNNTSFFSDDTDKMSARLKLVAILTVILALSRLISFEIILFLSDLMTALMIYFYSLSQNKCMAIMTMINGVIQMIYAFIKIYNVFTVTKATWFSFYNSLLFLIAIYAIVVYGLVCYYAYVGIVKYEHTGFGLPTTVNNNRGMPVSSNYGAISENNNNKFAAFSGKGVTVG
jgi:hypothetical protein